MRNNLLFTIKVWIFPILWYQNCTFSLLISFLYFLCQFFASPIVIAIPTILNSCCSFFLLLFRSRKFFAFASKISLFLFSSSGFFSFLLLKAIDKNKNENVHRFTLSAIGGNFLERDRNKYYQVWQKSVTSCKMDKKV